MANGVVNGVSGRPRFAAGALAAIVGLAMASGAWANSAEHAKLSNAERAFAKSYAALLPGLQKTSGSVLKAISNAGKDTDVEVVTLFTGLAKQWSIGTKRLVALKAPAPEAGLFAAVTRYVRAVEGDLLAVAQSGRTHSTAAAALATKHMQRDFTGFGAAVIALEKKLGL